MYLCGFLSNQQGYHTTNVFFGSSLPRATRLADEVISGSGQEIPLLDLPITLVVEDLHQTSDFQIVSIF